MDYSNRNTDRAFNYTSLPDVNSSSEGDANQVKGHRRHSCSNSGNLSFNSGFSPRSILKTSKSFDKRSNHTIRWDEDVIRMHDSERGTRMKIDEPRTPYMYYDSSADDLEGGVKAEDLSDALDMTTRDSSPNSSHPSDSWTDSETDNEPESPIKSDRKRRFHQLRSQHYDMKEVLAKARWQKSTSLEGGEVDEDEVDEDDDENKEKKKLENENENENKKKEKKLFKNPSPRDTLSFEDSKDSGDFSEYESYSSISSLTPPKKFSKN